MDVNLLIMINRVRHKNEENSRNAILIEHILTMLYMCFIRYLCLRNLQICSPRGISDIGKIRGSGAFPFSRVSKHNERFYKCTWHRACEPEPELCVARRLFSYNGGRMCQRIAAI